MNSERQRISFDYRSVALNSNFGILKVFNLSLHILIRTTEQNSFAQASANPKSCEVNWAWFDTNDIIRGKGVAPEKIAYVWNKLLGSGWSQSQFTSFWTRVWNPKGYRTQITADVKYQICSVLSSIETVRLPAMLVRKWKNKNFIWRRFNLREKCFIHVPFGHKNGELAFKKWDEPTI